MASKRATELPLIRVEDDDRVEVFDAGWPCRRTPAKKQVGVYITAKGQPKFHNDKKGFQGRRFDMTLSQWKKLRKEIDAIFEIKD